MTKEELNRVLENHLHWLQKDCDGWENMCADLEGANLRGANLKCADLRGASLKCADIEGANIEGANLRGANFKFANLRGASLKCADIEGANLRGADLKCANIEGADLRDANLRGAKNLPFIPFACPDTGAFIGWKKTRGKIIKLEIPADAKRCSATSEKCRCDKAKVLEIQKMDGNISDITKIRSDYDISFIYEVGKTVSVKDFCEDRWQECSQGIHFFIKRQSAVEY